MSGFVLSRLFGHFARSRSGGVASMFALTALPLMLVVGGTSEYASFQSVREELNSATDAAVLAATAKDTMSLTTSEAETLGASTFIKRLPSKIAAYVTNRQTSVSDANSARTAVQTYTADIPTVFLKLIGISKLTASGSATASASVPIYMDFYLLLDNTPSMGVAATTAGINKLVANTPDQCAFACHDLSTSPNDYYGLAKKLGVTMRIDLVRSATQKLMDTATATQQVKKQFRMAVYTFGSAGTARGLTSIAALTSDLAGAKTAAGAIDLMTVPYQGHDNDQYTNFDGIFTAINGNIANPGTGASATATPQKVLFFVSDGVADAYNTGSCGGSAVGGGRCQEPIDLQNCTTLKNRGIRIAVLYTTYLPLPTNGWYMSTVAPWSSQIAANMKSCASPGLYFEVSPSGGISEAMNALFNKAVQTAHLTR